MACCLLLRLKFKKTASEMIAHYDKTRVTMKNSGRQKALTVPSQLRYVGYYEKMLRQADAGAVNPGLLGKPLKRILQSIQFRNGPDTYDVNCAIYQQIGFVGEKVLKWRGSFVNKNEGLGGWVIEGGQGIELEGNFELVFTKDSGEKKKKEKRIGYTWLNTSMVETNETLVLTKSEIDKFHKDRHNRKFRCDLQAVLQFGAALQCNPMLKGGEASKVQ